MSHKVGFRGLELTRFTAEFGVNLYGANPLVGSSRFSTIIKPRCSSMILHAGNPTLETMIFQFSVPSELRITPLGSRDGKYINIEPSPMIT